MRTTTCSPSASRVNRSRDAPIAADLQRLRGERRVEAARVAADDARLRLRAEELRLKTQVATAHSSLEAAYRAVTLEERNRELAAEQLELARERYRVGAITFVDLTDAETRKSRADREYLSAVYAFHEALAALETAVGQNLRPRTGEE